MVGDEKYGGRCQDTLCVCVCVCVCVWEYVCILQLLYIELFECLTHAAFMYAHITPIKI